MKTRSRIAAAITGQDGECRFVGARTAMFAPHGDHVALPAILCSDRR